MQFSCSQAIQAQNSSWVCAERNLLGMMPFVILHLEPDREDTLRSHVMKNTHDPIFNQDFQFIGFSIEDIKRQTLVLRICNHAMSNSFIGNIHLPLADVELFGVIMQMEIIRTEEKEVRNLIMHATCIYYSLVPRPLWHFHAMLHGRKMLHV